MVAPSRRSVRGSTKKRFIVLGFSKDDVLLEDCKGARWTNIFDALERLPGAAGGEGVKYAVVLDSKLGNVEIARYIDFTDEPPTAEEQVWAKLKTVTRLP